MEDIQEVNDPQSKSMNIQDNQDDFVYENVDYIGNVNH